MGSFSDLLEPCRKILIQCAKEKRIITYGDLAEQLGLSHPRKKWRLLLDVIYEEEWKKTGRDPTLLVVYGSGKLKGLCRYFSLGENARSVQFDPNNRDHLAEFEIQKRRVWDYYGVTGIRRN